MAKLKGFKMQGFSRFELMIVIAVFVILTATLLNRLPYLQELAEKKAMELTVKNMRTGLHHQLIAAAIDASKKNATNILDVNPINWLQAPPNNYHGEVTTSSTLEILPGHWYFDSQEKHLVYRLNLSDHFVSTDDNVNKLATEQLTDQAARSQSQSKPKNKTKKEQVTELRFKVSNRDANVNLSNNLNNKLNKRLSARLELRTSAETAVAGVDLTQLQLISSGQWFDSPIL